MVRWARRRHLALPLEADAVELAARVAAFGAQTFAGHPSRLLDIGTELPPHTRLRMLISHGESLDATLRTSLTRTYGLQPLDSYGIAEVGAVAAQCRAADLYHLHTESVVLEVVDEHDGRVEPGGTGDVVVTGLHNPLMPMVRYRVHDRVTLPDRPCVCGYRGPALARIVGRSSDFAMGAAGERISPELLWLYNHLPSDVIYRHVRRYQVHQVPSGEIRVRLELHEPLPDEVESAMLTSYRVSAAGQPVTLHIEDDLGDRTPGKFRLVRSDAAR